MYSIIDNHKDFLLISKRPGVGLHRSGGHEGLAAVLKDDLGITELHTVHRLDTITSGLLVFAKNTNAARQLSYQFRNRLVEKYYLAVSDRRPKKKQGLVRGDMVKARRGAWKLARTLNNPALTQFFSYSMGGGLRLFVLKPHTGRTHQVRVALKSICSPIIGDPVYHSREYKGGEPDRGYLHSYSLTFRMEGRVFRFVDKPDTGALFTSEPFIKALERCAKPWELAWPVIH